MSDVQKVQLQNGDLLVVRIPRDHSVTSAAVDLFKRHLKTVIENMEVKAEVLIVTGDVSLEIVKESRLLELEERIAEIEKRVPAALSDLKRR